MTPETIKLGSDGARSGSRGCWMPKPWLFPPSVAGNSALLPTSVAIPALVLKPKLPGFHKRQET